MKFYQPWKYKFFLSISAEIVAIDQSYIQSASKLIMRDWNRSVTTTLRVVYNGQLARKY